MTSELLEFPGGLTGVALNLDEDSIGCVIMGEASRIEEGNEVRSTGRVLSVPVGDGLLGRVIDPLGNPIDGKGPVEYTETRLLETQAPSVVERQPVKEPLQTGIKAIDCDDADRPGSAPAHHRRPADRQDGDPDRHDHQPEGPRR